MRRDDKFAHLCAIRNRMPEPSRVPNEYWKTVDYSAVQLPLQLTIEPVELGHVPIHLWKKVLIVEGGTSYYAWRHEESGMVLL